MSRLEFGWSPYVGPLRITDDPFPLRDIDDGDNGLVDKAAEEFIQKFYGDFKNKNKTKLAFEA